MPQPPLRSLHADESPNAVKLQPGTAVDPTAPVSSRPGWIFNCRAIHSLGDHCRFCNACGGTTSLKGRRPNRRFSVRRFSVRRFSVRRFSVPLRIALQPADLVRSLAPGQTN
jgi:hypothetical protein